MAKIRFIQKEFHFLIVLFLRKVGRRVPFPLFHDCYSIGSSQLTITSSISQSLSESGMKNDNKQEKKFE